jgi:hypothetical protein
MAANAYACGTLADPIAVYGRRAAATGRQLHRSVATVSETAWAEH